MVDLTSESRYAPLEAEKVLSLRFDDTDEMIGLTS